MGQYFLVANLDKEEYLHPHRLGEGMKFLELVESDAYTLRGLALLLRQSDETGGGDISANALTDEPYLGHWAGDSVAIIGDYDKSALFARVRSCYVDISDAVNSMLARHTNVYRT